MPASTRTRFTLAHAKASARLPKSVISAQTKTPTIHALRKQPRTNTATGSHPGASTRKSKAHQPSTASKRKRAPPRAIPTSHEPRVRCRIPMGARNWCFSDFDQTSSRTAYATSSWQTLTTDSAMVPISTKDACSGVRWRNRVMRPMESTPTIGQKRSSKKKNTLREAMSALRTRSEEHTSELQSPCNLVCRLLLEKKKKIHRRRASNGSSLPLQAARPPARGGHSTRGQDGAPTPCAVLPGDGVQCRDPVRR